MLDLNIIMLEEIEKYVIIYIINENTLEVDEIDNLERVSVKQIGRNSVVLSSSDDFGYNSLNASK